MTETTPSEAGVARWSRLAATGFFLAAAGPVLLLIAGLGWGLAIGEVVPWFLTAIGVGLIAGVLVLRFGTWAKVLGIVAGALLAMLLFWTAFGLAEPMSFFDFVPGVLVIPGVLLGIGGCIAALRARRTPGPAPREARAIRTVVTAVAALALLSGIFTLVGRSAADEAQAQAVVSMHDFEYEHDTYEFAGGWTVLVRNSDPFVHSFTVDELDIDVTVRPGSSTLVEIPERPGAYLLYCVPHTGNKQEPTDDDMTANLTIT